MKGRIKVCISMSPLPTPSHLRTASASKKKGGKSIVGVAGFGRQIMHVAVVYMYDGDEMT
jgi:hypothetical protein